MKLELSVSYDPLKGNINVTGPLEDGFAFMGLVGMAVVTLVEHRLSKKKETPSGITIPRRGNHSPGAR